MKTKHKTIHITCIHITIHATYIHITSEVDIPATCLNTWMNMDSHPRQIQSHTHAFTHACIRGCLTFLSWCIAMSQNWLKLVVADKPINLDKHETCIFVHKYELMLNVWSSLFVMHQSSLCTYTCTHMRAFICIAMVFTFTYMLLSIFTPTCICVCIYIHTWWWNPGQYASVTWNAMLIHDN